MNIWAAFHLLKNMNFIIRNYSFCLSENFYFFVSPTGSYLLEPYCVMFDRSRPLRFFFFVSLVVNYVILQHVYNMCLVEILLIRCKCLCVMGFPVLSINFKEA